MLLYVIFNLSWFGSEVQAATTQGCTDCNQSKPVNDHRNQQHGRDKGEASPKGHPGVDLYQHLAHVDQYCGFGGHTLYQGPALQGRSGRTLPGHLLLYGRHRRVHVLSVFHTGF